MIRFDNWTIQADGEVIARQFDNLTRTLTVSGDIPTEWEWAMLVQVDDAMDIIPLTATEGALSVVLTAQQLSIAGYYQMQLRATQGDKVKHTNVVTVYIPASLSGDAHWPEIPSEFTQLERRVNEKAKEAKGYSTHPPIHGDNGNWWLWDGEAYADSGEPYTGEPGADGKDGAPGADGKDGADGPQGPAGADGKTPVRGVDYYTPEDVEAIVADATARVEASLGGAYELVEEITTTEELASLTRTAHPDGTPYNFKAVYVSMVVPVGTVAGTFNLYSRYNSTNVGMLGITGINASSKRHVNYYTHQLHGLWLTRGGACGGNYGSSDTHYFKDIPNLVADWPVINRINLTMVTGDVLLPVGTTIKIYGVRA